MGIFSRLPNEMLSKVAESVDVGHLSVLAGLDPRLRSIVKSEIQDRVYSLLAVFIPKNGIPTLLTALNGTSSVIGGSVAQAVITPTSRESGPRILISESSSSSCLSPVIASAFTSQMNFITADHVYSIYPHLTTKLKSFQIKMVPLDVAKRTARMAYAARLQRRGVKVIDDDEERLLCEKRQFCPEMIRYIGMEPENREKLRCDDIGIMCWGKDKNEERFLKEREWYSSSLSFIELTVDVTECPAPQQT
ncbi:hypothetical protein GALMADRAFT_142207 [Galerina marginata CBS 339.88]|uniref:F-box domain-containing protein n=1 Tax=Galerina marginata (strain CBS 339.88) TaxID=685588 RepID=A0A067SS95_GALM3|nr:hypothetical protein GALMADRAFT_142207 [Galerina marginata CBS 339.88]